MTTRAKPERNRGTGPASSHWNPAGMAGVIVADEGADAGAGDDAGPVRRAGAGVRLDSGVGVAVWSG